MNKTPTFLLSGLATVMVMIALVQTGTIRFNDGLLFAQFERNALILKRELVVNSPVIGQEKQDVLKLKNGSTYNGEFVKIESGNVLFKISYEGAFGPQRVKINEIKMLKLSDGTEIIKNGKIKRKAKETITIQPGDKIMVTYGAISKSVTGLFYGFDNGEISIQKFDKDQKAFYTIIPAHLVANIIVLQIKSAESVPQVAVAISCGFIMVALSASDGFDAEVGLTMG
ncbi:uncharacterized protein METZ01_LOCUS465643, partial [marine metagenome]